MLIKKFQCTHESNVAIGYFAVYREYMPRGVNGKPLEKTTLAGNIVGAESSSMYKSMYQSIFNKKQLLTTKPANSSNNNNIKSFKKGWNIFYIMLRYSHLMLYNNKQQIKVHYIISLTHHYISIYNGGEEILERELYVKRNTICLIQKKDSIANLQGLISPFYLFSETQSAKEDFYHTFAEPGEDSKFARFTTLAAAV